MVLHLYISTYISRLTLDTEVGPKSYLFNTPKRKKYGKLLARSHNPSKGLAMQVLKDTKAREWIVKGIGKILRFELKQLCSMHVTSIQRSKDKEHLYYVIFLGKLLPENVWSSVQH